jgi:hypothetical protein
MSESNSNSLFTQETNIVIDKLFDTLFALYPSSYYFYIPFVDIHEVKRIWAQAFLLDGIINKQGMIDEQSIERGIKKIYGFEQPYMPSCGQFINFCRDENSWYKNITDTFNIFNLNKANEM